MTPTKKRNLELVAEMKSINNDPALKVYGSPRMTAELNARGHEISENTVAKLMNRHSLAAKGAKVFHPPKTTTPDESAKYSPNLIKAGKPTRFGEVLISDITFIDTREGWLYLAVVIDLYSRTVLGWQAADHMASPLVTGALKEALSTWSFDPAQSTFHSDRGSQYTGEMMRDLLRKNGITQSMSAKGNCYDNATCESFFAALKREMLPEGKRFISRFQAKSTLFNHIEGFYNTRRRHSSLGMLAPVQFLKQNREQQVAA